MNAIHRLAAGALFAACALAAHAELADRTRRIEVTATDAHADHRRQTADFSGDVVVSQGTLEIRADRVQMQAGPDGERRASRSARPARRCAFASAATGPASGTKARPIAWNTTASPTRCA